MRREKIVRGLPESYFLDSLIWFLEARAIIRRVDSETPFGTLAGWKFHDSRVPYGLTDVSALRTVLHTVESRQTRRQVFQV